MPIILMIKTQDGQITELPVLNKIILGRSASSDFKINDTKMSGSHCSFEINTSGQLVFTDLGSSNGSYINNSQVNKTLMRINDIIRVGDTLIKLEEDQLTAIERLAIGTSKVSLKNKDKTLPDMGTNVAQMSREEEMRNENDPKKKTILLSKLHKEKKKNASNWSKAENVIDQEASSGKTKFLKLEKKKK